MMIEGVEFKAIHDVRGNFIPLHHSRRFIVVKFINGKYADIVGRFTSMQSAEKRARQLSR